MIIEKALSEKVLTNALSTGGDFAEIFAEDTLSSTIRMIDNKIDVAVRGKEYGVGIRVYKGFRNVYATTNDLSEKGLLDCAKSAATAIGDGSFLKDIVLKETKVENIHPILLYPSDVNINEKVDLIRPAYEIIKKYDEKIIQASVALNEVEQNVQIANSDGLFVSDKRVYTRNSLVAVASDGKENQTGAETPGRMMGFEVFRKEIDINEHANSAAELAMKMLYAKNAPSGNFPVAIENGFGGVIFHEACAHSLEATSVAIGASEFAGKLGQKIANSKVTAIDDGTIPNMWGSLNIDDEGTKTQKNVLIENGILKNYLIDRLNSRRMEMPITGSGRRESYQYAPTSRMTNTYIDNGQDENADIITSIDYGIYAKKMGGGSVNPVTGEFNFAVSEGYLVKNGQIAEPIRGASLIGKGSDILQDIDMVGKNLALAEGMCGSLSGSIPVNVGQPLIRVSKITVGGR